MLAQCTNLFTSWVTALVNIVVCSLVTFSGGVKQYCLQLHVALEGQLMQGCILFSSTYRGCFFSSLVGLTRPSNDDIQMRGQQTWSLCVISKEHCPQKALSMQ